MSIIGSIHAYKFPVIAVVVGLAACSMVQFLLLDAEGGALQESSAFNTTAWELPAQLADGWRFTTCSAVSQEERLQGYSRARSVLIAADVLATKLREVSSRLQGNSAGLLTVLPTFEALEEPFVQLRDVLQSSDAELRCLSEQTTEASDDEELRGLLVGLPRARRTARSQLIEAVLAARRASDQAEVDVGLSERESYADSSVFQAAETIQRLEDVAVSEAEADQSADSYYDVGMLLSEVFLISRSRNALEKAEKFLRKGEEMTEEPERHSRALARAERLHDHAEVLATEWEFDRDVAGSRYRNAVKVALAQQNSQAASRYMARYAHFLDGHGSLEEALNTARKALELDKSEPLSRYLQVSLSRRLGELRTESQIRLAETHLNNIAGRLEMWPEIEAARATLREELIAWHKASEAGSHVSVDHWFDRLLSMGRACLEHGDVAKITLCLLCKTVLPA